MLKFLELGLRSYRRDLFVYSYDLLFQKKAIRAFWKTLSAVWPIHNEMLPQIGSCPRQRANPHWVHPTFHLHADRLDRRLPSCTADKSQILHAFQALIQPLGHLSL